MKKRVKGDIEKHYCDRCGKLIYDDIPKGTSSIELFGIPMKEFKRKRHSEYRVLCSGFKKRGIKAGEYCLECHDEMFAE